MRQGILHSLGYWAPLLLVGMILGSWPYRHETHRLAQEVQELREEARRIRRSAGTLGQLAEFMRMPEPWPPTPPTISTSEIPDAPNATNPPPARLRRPLAALRPRPGDERSLAERIREAEDLWRVRVEAARNDFLARTGFTPEQASRFDVLIEAMNLRLRGRIEEFARAVQDGQPLTPEMGARLIRDLSADVVTTYEELNRELPQWRSVDQGRLDLGNFVDPKIAEPLVTIEGYLRGFEWRSER